MPNSSPPNWLGMFGLLIYDDTPKTVQQNKWADMHIWLWKITLMLISTTELEKQSAFIQ